MRPILSIMFGLSILLHTEAVSAQGSGGNSSNFVSYFDKILVKLNASSQTDQYILHDKAGQDLKLKANNEFKTFLSLDYEFIGFSFGFAPKLFRGNNDDQLKGKSSFTDYKFQFFPGQWLQTVSFNKTKGYYVENTGDFIPGWNKNEDSYLQIPSLKNVQWALSTSYVFNPDFSFKNLIYQTQWQKRSAGSFVPSLYYDYNLFSVDFSGMQSRQEDFNLRLGIGYYYTFIIAHKFYVAPNIIPSVGLRFSKLRSTDNGNTTSEQNTYTTRFLEGGLKAGYNSGRWVAGAGITFNFSWYNEGPSKIVENNKLYGIVYIGYRFNAPGMLTKAYNALNDRLP